MCKCHDVINGIDCVSQEYLGQILSLTNVMLRAMETPDFWKHPLNIKEMFGLIQFLAQDLLNYVNCAAEAVGSNYIDKADRETEDRVLGAFRKAMSVGG